jgi:hypothetical protein
MVRKLVLAAAAVVSCEKCGAVVLEENGALLHLISGATECSPMSRAVTTSTLDAIRDEIVGVFKEVCPDTPLGRFQLRRVQEMLDTLHDYTWEVAVKRQAKVIAAAQDGSLTWRKDETEAEWGDRKAIDAEEDAIDAMEEALNPRLPPSSSEERFRAEQEWLKRFREIGRRRDGEGGLA